jgi:hypothetical protein
MKVTLEVEFGETTCSVKPHKFCRFLGEIRFGTRSVCCLFFDPRGDFVQLHRDTPYGWLQRCPQCLEKWPPKEKTE